MICSSQSVYVAQRWDKALQSAFKFSRGMSTSAFAVSYVSYPSSPRCLAPMLLSPVQCICGIAVIYRVVVIVVIRVGVRGVVSRYRTCEAERILSHDCIVKHLSNFDAYSDVVWIHRYANAPCW
jgi:hypothetical protein